MAGFAVIEAPSPLGVGPRGVERLPDALKRAGLLKGLGTEVVSRLPYPPYDAHRDPEVLVLNGPGVVEYARRLADVVDGVRRDGRVPLVLGGDCSVLLGPMLALRRRGRYGLFFIDGHADFYAPEASYSGEVSDMELALLTGRGPTPLTDIDGLRPLVRDEDAVPFGFRDADQVAGEGGTDVREVLPRTFDLAAVRAMGVAAAAREALESLSGNHLEGIWVHFDVDVLDDGVMPAVDYRLPGGGLSFDEVSGLLRSLTSSGRMVGLTLTIFNPNLDPDGSIAKRLVSCLVKGLA